MTPLSISRFSFQLITYLLTSRLLYSFVTPQTLLPGNATDRLALLSFKSLLSSTSSFSEGVLSSWNGTVDYCSWQGVHCGAARHPGRVTSLTLSDLQIEGTLSPSLANLTFLRSLSLGGNALYGKIPPELGQLWRLDHLNLSVNSLVGEVPAALGRCTSLKYLGLRNNMLQGSIPANLTGCRQLETLNLAVNGLTNHIPPELGSLGKLKALYLNNNSLTGNLPPSLGNLSALLSLEVGFNSLSGEIPAELGKIVDLVVLNLIFNRFSGQVPKNLYNFSSLYGLGLGKNLLSGTLPPDFGRNLPRLTTLYLYNNQFEGPVPLFITNATELGDFELSNNRFSGPLPPDIGNLRSLSKLRLGDNQLEARTPDDWRFLASLANCKDLDELDLSNNLFAGPIPESIGNLSHALRYMRLRGNMLSGAIPASLGNLSTLIGLDLERNQLSGTLPDAFGNLLQLEALSVHSNKLFGEIPASLGNLTKMNELFLSSNDFLGSIPSSFASFRKLGMFDISYNNLIGTIPTGLLTISSLSNFLNLSHNSFDGPLPNEVGKLTNLKVLDVSWNKFSGPIPPLVGDCLVLEYLYLQGNQFNGSVPERLQDIKGIQILDLSLNQLSGPIPKFLENLKVQFLNLSFNNLEGEVPSAGVFSNVSLFSISGNSKLCGGNSKLNLKSCARKKHKLSSSALAIVIVVSVVCCVLLLVGLFFLYSGYYKKAKTSPQYPTDDPLVRDQLLRVSYADIFDATDGFSSSSKIGSGGSGTVYKCYLKKEEKMVAVKVLNRNLHGALNSFVKECEALRNLRHRNLVKILTSCVSEDFHGNGFRALIYDFMSNGSLEMWLHRKPLCEHDSMGSWSFTTTNFFLVQRLNVAIDIASALDYLHNQTTTPLVHRDLKPSNILLNEDMTAFVSDFGISTFLSLTASSTSIGVKGSLGYIAPECAMGNPVTALWDVYSFGVLLLELFTGKRPTDESFLDGTNLHKYVKSYFSDSILDILDPTILPDDSYISNRTRECIISLINIALICSSELPSERMVISEVLKQLEEAKCALIDENV